MPNARLLLAILLALCATPLAFSLATTARTGMQAWWAGVIGALVVCGALVRIEHRRDARPAAIFGLVFGLVVIVGVMVERRDATTLGHYVVLGAYGAGGVLGVAAAGRSLRATFGERDEIANALIERASVAHIFESDGVQWTLAGGGAVGGTSSASLAVVLQSVVAAPRTVTLALEDITGTLNRRGSVTWQPLGPIRLEPGAVIAIRIPLVAGGEPATASAVYVRVSAEGPAARRILRQRGIEPKDRVRWWDIALGVLAGFVTWGGGVSVTLANPGAARSTIAPPPATLELVRASVGA